jgi:hypothetical protein
MASPLKHRLVLYDWGGVNCKVKNVGDENFCED